MKLAKIEPVSGHPPVEDDRKLATRFGAFRTSQPLETEPVNAVVMKLALLPMA